MTKKLSEKIAQPQKSGERHYGRAMLHNKFLTYKIKMWANSAQ